MIQITEEQLKSIGFKLTEQYAHDEFHTNRYQKGVLEVEFTYEIFTLVTCDVTINEINCMPIEFEDIKALDKIFSKNIKNK